MSIHLRKEKEADYTYYSWLVYDNSDEKRIKVIYQENVFSGETTSQMSFFEETILIMHNFDNFWREKFWKYILYREQFQKCPFW